MSGAQSGEFGVGGVKHQRHPSSGFSFGSEDEFQKLLATHFSGVPDGQFPSSEVSPLLTLTSDGAMLQELLQTLELGGNGTEVPGGRIFSEDTINAIMGEQLREMAAGNLRELRNSLQQAAAGAATATSPASSPVTDQNGTAAGQQAAQQSPAHAASSSAGSMTLKEAQSSMQAAQAAMLAEGQQDNAQAAAVAVFQAHQQQQQQAAFVAQHQAVFAQHQAHAVAAAAQQQAVLNSISTGQTGQLIQNADGSQSVLMPIATQPQVTATVVHQTSQQQQPTTAHVTMMPVNGPNGTIQYVPLLDSRLVSMPATVVATPPPPPPVTLIETPTSAATPAVSAQSDVLLADTQQMVAAAAAQQHQLQVHHVVGMPQVHMQPPTLIKQSTTPTSTAATSAVAVLEAAQAHQAVQVQVQEHLLHQHQQQQQQQSMAAAAAALGMVPISMGNVSTPMDISGMNIPTSSATEMSEDPMMAAMDAATALAAVTAATSPRFATATFGNNNNDNTTNSSGGVGNTRNTGLPTTPTGRVSTSHKGRFPGSPVLGLAPGQGAGAGGGVVTTGGAIGRPPLYPQHNHQQQQQASVPQLRPAGVFHSASLMSQQVPQVQVLPQLRPASINSNASQTAAMTAAAAGGIGVGVNVGMPRLSAVITTPQLAAVNTTATIHMPMQTGPHGHMGVLPSIAEQGQLSLQQQKPSDALPSASLPQKPSHKRERSIRSSNPFLSDPSTAPTEKSAKGDEVDLLGGVMDVTGGAGISTGIDTMGDIVQFCGMYMNAAGNIEFAVAGGMVVGQQTATGVSPDSALLQAFLGLDTSSGDASPVAPDDDGPLKSHAAAANVTVVQLNPPNTAPNPIHHHQDQTQTHHYQHTHTRGTASISSELPILPILPAAFLNMGPPAPDVEAIIKDTLAPPPGKRRGRPPGSGRTIPAVAGGPPGGITEPSDAQILQKLLEEDGERKRLPAEELKKLMRKEKNRISAAMSRQNTQLYNTHLEDQVRRLEEQRLWLANRLESPPEEPAHRVMLQQAGHLSPASKPPMRHISM